jgi:GNAT superfamily N-acetyltransferase
VDRELVRRAVEVNWRNLALGHETFQADGATFVRNAAYPDIHDANFVYAITATEPDDVDRLLARARAEYAHCGELTFRLDPFTPPEFVARLALESPPRDTGALVMVLEGDLAPIQSYGAEACEIRPCKTEDDWRTYLELKRADWAEHVDSVPAADRDKPIGDGLAATNRLKSPPARYFLAHINGKAVGHFDAWEGTNDVGQVEDLFVLPEYRHRGIATQLIHHCVRDARAHGAGPVVIVAAASDTPKNMYATMGWRPVALCLQYGVALNTA